MSSEQQFFTNHFQTNQFQLSVNRAYIINVSKFYLLLSTSMPVPPNINSHGFNQKYDQYI